MYTHNYLVVLHFRLRYSQWRHFSPSIQPSGVFIATKRVQTIPLYESFPDLTIYNVYVFFPFNFQFNNLLHTLQPSAVNVNNEMYMYN